MASCALVHCMVTINGRLTCVYSVYEKGRQRQRMGVGGSAALNIENEYVAVLRCFWWSKSKLLQPTFHHGGGGGGMNSLNRLG